MLEVLHTLTPPAGMSWAQHLALADDKRGCGCSKPMGWPREARGIEQWSGGPKALDVTTLAVLQSGMIPTEINHDHVQTCLMPLAAAFNLDKSGHLGHVFIVFRILLL